MATPVAARKPEPRIALERVIGTTSLCNSAFAVNRLTGEVATAAGCIVVLYSPAKNKQTRFFRTKQPISCLAFSPDGSFLAAGQKGRRPTIAVWSVGTGLQRAEFGDYNTGVASIAFTPDARFIVGTGFKADRCLHIWDWSKEEGPVKVASGKLSQKVNSLAFVAGGEIFVTAGEKHLKFWDIEPLLKVIDTTQAVYPINLASKPAVMSEGGPEFETFVDVVCGAGAAAGCVYALSSAGMLCTFDVGERLMEQWLSLKVRAGFCLDIVDDTIFAGCSDGIVRAFSLPSLVFKGLLPLPPAVGRANVSVFDRIPEPRNEDVYPACVAVRAFGGGQQVAALYGDRSMFLWDVTNFDKIVKLRSLLCHSGPIWDVAAASSAAVDDSLPALPPNTFATCSSDCTVRFWNLNAKATLTRQDSSESSAPVASMAGVENGVVRDGVQSAAPPVPPKPGLKSPQSTNCRGARPRNAYMKELLCVTYVDDEERGTGDTKKDGHFYSGCGNDPHQQYKSASWPARCVLNSPFDTENGLPLAPLLDVGVRAISLQPGNRHLATGDRQGNVRIFDIVRNACVFYEVAHDAEVISLAYSPVKGRYLASGSRDRLVHVFDMAASKGFDVLTTLADHSAGVSSVMFTPNGNQLITAATDAAINFYKIPADPLAADASFARTKQLTAPHVTVYDMDIDATSKNLATVGQDNRVHVWALRTGKILRNIKPEVEAKDVNRVCFDPSGLYMAAASLDKAITLYDFFSGKCLARTCGHADVITGLTFTEDCRRMISVSGDGCIFVWRLSASLTKAMQDRVDEIERAKGTADVSSLTSPPVSTTQRALDDSNHTAASNDGVNNTVLTNVSSLPRSTPGSPPGEMAFGPTIMAAMPPPVVARVGASSKLDARPPVAPRPPSPLRTRPVPGSVPQQMEPGHSLTALPAPVQGPSPTKPPVSPLHGSTDVLTSIVEMDLAAAPPLKEVLSPGRGYRGETAVKVTSPQVASSPVTGGKSVMDSGELEFRQSVLPAWALGSKPTAPPDVPTAGVRGSATVTNNAARPVSKWAAFMTTSKTNDLFVPPAMPLSQVPESEVEYLEPEADVEDREDEPLPAANVIFHKPIEDIPITRESFSVSVFDRAKRHPEAVPELPDGPSSNEELEPVSAGGASERATPGSTELPVPVAAPHSVQPPNFMRQSLSLTFTQKGANASPVGVSAEPSPSLQTKDAGTIAETVPARMENNNPASTQLPTASLSKLGLSVAAKLRRASAVTSSAPQDSATSAPEAAVSTITQAEKPPVSEDVSVTAVSDTAARISSSHIDDLLNETQELQILLQNARQAAEAEAATAAALLAPAQGVSVVPEVETVSPESKVQTASSNLDFALKQALDTLADLKRTEPTAAASLQSFLIFCIAKLQEATAEAPQESHATS